MADDPVTWTATLYSAAVWVWLGWLAIGTPIGALLLAWGLYGRRGPTGVPTCPGCGQDMRGVQQLKCPNCAYQPATESEWFRPRRRTKIIWLALLLLLPWAYPLGSLTLQAWDRANYARLGWPTDSISLSPVALPHVLERTPAWIHPLWNRITVVHLTTRMPRDEQFTTLSYLTSLRVIRVNAGQKLTDGALEPFEGGSNLTDVELMATKITDKGVKHLEHSTQLTHLSLPGAQLNGSSMQYLRPLPLRQLNLAHNQISSGALRHIGAQQELTHLNLTNARIVDRALPALRSLPDLRVLVLDQSPITNAALGELAQHKKLQSLSLKGTEVTPEAAKMLFERLPDLQQIHFKSKTLERAGAEPGA